MIGLGTKEVMIKLKRMVETYGIEDNVDFLGPVYDFNTKISILACSRLFVLPSYEENWAIVVGEALTTGIPVIMYCIPEIVPIWKNNALWVRRGDVTSFAEKIVELLSNEIIYKDFTGKGIEFMRQYDWAVLAERELQISLGQCQALPSE
jgi:glycosyltransferase involved in cell wall biosynthesis